MVHLLISREYPPGTYPMGGIGTYVRHIARLLAEHGETVHVIAERWQGAPRAVEHFCDGRLTVHRVWTARPLPGRRTPHADADLLEAMSASPFPAQAFGWQAALLTEDLTARERVDVIEAQDYEAPLYAFLVRRAHGLGPDRRPPCFVHLHTTHAQVCRANGWPVDTPSALMMDAQERHAIAHADALLAPSRFLARETEAAYGRPAGSIAAIPYPVGVVPAIARTAETWRDGTIVFVGRYETRKGLCEWVPAAVDAARRRPGLRFAFVGADTPVDPRQPGSSVRATLEALVPPELRASFSFEGPVDRATLWQRLAAARMAVVPSRWENFPNACVEAMCSGLPALVAPHGGMAEMVEDAATGWIAASNATPDLASALDRALDVPAEALAAMGARAAAAVRALCDNHAIVARQLAFRRELVATAPTTGTTGTTTRSSGPVPDLPSIAALRHAAAAGGYGEAGRARPGYGARLAAAGRAVTAPRYTASWLLWRGRRLLRRAFR